MALIIKTKSSGAPDPTAESKESEDLQLIADDKVMKTRAKDLKKEVARLAELIENATKSDQVDEAVFSYVSDKLKQAHRAANTSTARIQKLSNRITGYKTQVEELKDKLKQQELANKTLTRDTVAKGKSIDPKAISESPELAQQLAQIYPAPHEVPESRSNEYQEAINHRRRQIERLLLRGVASKTIAEQLDINVDTVYKDVNVIRAQWAASVDQLDLASLLGESLAFKRDVRNTALRSATEVIKVAGPNGDRLEDKHTPKDRNAYLRTALTADDDAHSLLTRVGVYKVYDPVRELAKDRHTSQEQSLDQFFSHIIQNGVVLTQNNG